MNITDLVLRGDYHSRERETTVEWRSPNLDCEVDGRNDRYGVMIRLTARHDTNRKHFVASLSRVHYNYRGGFTAFLYTPSDQVTYPWVTVAYRPVARYSAKALREFFTDTLTRLDLTDDTTVRGMLAEAHAFTA
jgi:hypothetical protein